MRIKILFLTALSVCALGLPLVLADTGHAPSSRGTMTDPHEGYNQSDMPKGIIGVAMHVSARRVGDPATLYIRAIHPEGPAAKAGLAHGDEILMVNDMPLTGKTYQEVVVMIRGEIGKSVKLTVKGARGKRDVSILRISEDMLMGERKT
ncbi:MAG: PDZ domain-containing protein [Nitrospirales bacterium]